MSLESYYQQTGRAGRDGYTQMYIVWNKTEFEKNEWIQQLGCDSIKREKFYQTQTNYETIYISKNVELNGY